MPYGEVKLVPGVNTERTPTLLEAGISQSQLVRFKDGLVQKYGGWQKYYNFALSGTPRDLHAWEDLNSTNRLLVGTTSQLAMITSGSLVDITPQQKTTNPAVSFTTVINTPTVEITDAGIATITTFDSIMLNTPIAVGGLVLSGLYPVTAVTGVTTYKITASINATSNASTAGAVPVFTTVSGSAAVSVLITAHGVAVGDRVVFQVTTTGNGVTIFGHQTVASVTDANNFKINAQSQATGSGSFSMNSGTAQILYYINLGPAALGSGYGLGTYGSGGYGTGTATSVQTGTAITATDWTSDNWGQIILSCPSGGGVYQYDPTGGFTNSGLIATAPPFNGGIFVSNSLQILFCWGSSQVQIIGVERDPMLISWSDLGDYTSFIPLTTNQAGSFRIPIGSTIRGGMAVSNQNLFWTDLDLWAANYCGFPLVFGFNKIGAGAGAISSHAMQQLRNAVYWMGSTNFYVYSGSGVSVIPCPVWDAVFQNLNTAYGSNVRAMPNTGFNEAGWLYPSTASTNGECDSYVKMNITEPNAPWDYGTLARSAWIDQTILGNPVSANPTGIIYQQETTRDADGAPLMASFTSGYFYLAEGQEFAFVDQIIPDMKWDVFGGSSSAQVSLTFNVLNYPGDTPTVYGPYIMNSTTEYISVRFRGRQMSVTVASNDNGSWWRLGKIRYRYAPAGRR
jgi:hypothetical protein